MKRLLFPGNSRSSIVSFFRSFLTLQTCWQFFRLENLTITVSFVLQHNDPLQYGQEKYYNQVCQRYLKLSPPGFLQTLRREGMPTISRHSRLEYLAFTQHCLFKVVNLVNKKLLTVFVTASSACSFEIDSLSLSTSSRTVLSLSSNLLCRDRTIGVRSCLRSLSSDLPVHVAIQLIKSY